MYFSCRADLHLWVGALNLCDLAGSERLARSQATGIADVFHHFIIVEGT